MIKKVILGEREKRLFLINTQTGKSIIEFETPIECVCLCVCLLPSTDY